jgi:hypothetical protein
LVLGKELFNAALLCVVSLCAAAWCCEISNNWLRSPSLEPRAALRPGEVYVGTACCVDRRLGGAIIDGPSELEQGLAIEVQIAEESGSVGVLIFTWKSAGCRQRKRKGRPRLGVR